MCHSAPWDNEAESWTEQTKLQAGASGQACERAAARRWAGRQAAAPACNPRSDLGIAICCTSIDSGFNRPAVAATKYRTSGRRSHQASSRGRLPCLMLGLYPAQRRGSDPGQACRHCDQSAPVRRFKHRLRASPDAAETEAAKEGDAPAPAVVAWQPARHAAHGTQGRTELQLY